MSAENDIECNWPEKKLARELPNLGWNQCFHHLIKIPRHGGGGYDYTSLEHGVPLPEGATVVAEYEVGGIVCGVYVHAHNYTETYSSSGTPIIIWDQFKG